MSNLRGIKERLVTNQELRRNRHDGWCNEAERSWSERYKGKSKSSSEATEVVQLMDHNLFGDQLVSVIYEI